MQEVNDNMDELFRRAAENYPLDTSQKDWNKVLLALQNEQEVVQTVKKDSRGRFLWLLLLLPLGLICNRIVSFGDTDKVASTNTKQSESGNSFQPEKNQDKNASTFNSNTETGNTEISNSVQKTNTNNSVAAGNSRPDQNTDQKLTDISSNKKFTKKNSRNAMASNVIAIKNNNQKSKAKEIGLSKTDHSQLNSQVNDETKGLLTKNIEQKEPYQLSVNELDPTNKNIVAPEVKSKTENKKEKKFYVGIMGGIDITTIKFQKIEDAGYNYGVLMGYQINKKWSVETGVYQDKKFYYTEGEYFNTSKIWMPANSKITEVTGNCKMIEIPLTVRYNLSATPKKSWFLSTGATSYIMQKEDYDYTYYYGNSGSYATHNKKYNSDSKQFFAALHVTGGYTRKLNKTTDLRIEPYIKLPLYGMGVGQLRFISTGLHLGITKNIF